MRHEELQGQARTYASKLAIAEGEVARLRAEAARLGDAAARGEGEAGELHRALGSERQQSDVLRQQLEESEQGRDAAMAAARSLEVGQFLTHALINIENGNPISHACI